MDTSALTLGFAGRLQLFWWQAAGGFLAGKLKLLVFLRCSSGWSKYNLCVGKRGAPPLRMHAQEGLLGLSRNLKF